MLLEKIQKDISESYGSFEEPNWSFVAKRYSKDPYQSIIKKLHQLGEIEETTDLNDDCSLAIYLYYLRITLRLSLVGGYACIHNEKGTILARDDLKSSIQGKKIIQLLSTEEIILLTEKELERQIKFENELLPLYAVLFSSDELTG